MHFNEQVKKDYFWNTASSAMNAAASVLQLWVITRVLGSQVAGLFTLGYATITAQANTVGLFEVRLFQATDVSRRYSFGTYHASRFVTCALMLIGVFGYSLLTNGVTYDTLIICLIALWRLVDEFEDVFHGEFQRRGRLDMATRACFFRVGLTTLAFILVILISKNMLLASVITIVVAIGSFLQMNLSNARSMFAIRPVFEWRQVFSLLGSCLPLCVGAFLYAFIGNAPRIGISKAYGLDLLASYAYLFMPAYVINLLCGFVYKPLLTRLAEIWVRKEYQGFFSAIRKTLVGTIAATILILAICYFLGIPVLGWFFGVYLSPFRSELLLIVLAGGFNAAGIVLYYGLVTMRRQHLILVVYAVGALAALILTELLVPPLAMMGAAIAYAGAMAIFVVLAYIFCFIVGRNRAE